MKKLLNLSMMITLTVAVLPYCLQAKPGEVLRDQSDTTRDPKKGPFNIDLSKHPEVMARAQDMVKNGAISFHPNSNGSTVSDADKQVIRDILAYIVAKRLVKSEAEVTSFKLTVTSFSVNGKAMRGNMQTELKAKYIKSDDYMVYYGDGALKGNGIFQRRDNL